MHSPLAKPSATQEVLERHGFRLKKSLGQNFLVNDDVIGKILDLANVSGGQSVLEVGTGIGTLTSALLGMGASVIAVERDPLLPPVLDDTLSESSGKWIVIEKDALDVEESDLADASSRISAAIPGKMVSNLPYSVAATIVLRYFQKFSSLESMTVMVQKEVAERMMAKPGTKSYGAYTVKLSMYAKPCGSFSVAPGNFMPPPHVDSTVIRLDRIGLGDLGLSDDVVKAACEMADAAFMARRKTIANSCKQYFSGRGLDALNMLPSIFERAGIDPGIRGEALERDDYLRLGEAFVSLCK